MIQQDEPILEECKTEINNILKRIETYLAQNQPHDKISESLQSQIISGLFPMIESESSLLVHDYLQQHPLS